MKTRVALKYLVNDSSFNDFTLFDLTPQTAFLGFLNVDSKPLLIQSHLLLISKMYIYNSRRSESLILISF